MTVVELDDVRHSLRLTKKQVCDLVGIHQSTYQRWLKWARGDLDGCKPQPRSIRALREVLAAEFEQEPDSASDASGARGQAGSPAGGGPSDQANPDAGTFPARRQTPGRAA